MSKHNDEMRKLEEECSICGDDYTGIGNNAWPYEGRCCKACNEAEVILHAWC